ncbi:MAG: hypothetical protein WBI20_10150 [Burkholderiaceae bacterium]
MNQQALFDAVLALVALWVAWGAGREMPAVRLGAALLAAAAALGTLRFSGLLVLPELHQSMSMLSAGVGLPLLGVAMVWSNAGVARQARYAWCFGVAAAVLCLLLTVLAEVKLWPAVSALTAVVVMLGWSLARRHWWGVAAGASMLVALLGFASKRAFGSLSAADLLHLGLALGLWLYSRWLSNLVLHEASTERSSAAAE